MDATRCSVVACMMPEPPPPLPLSARAALRPAWRRRSTLAAPAPARSPHLHALPSRSAGIWSKALVSRSQHLPHRHPAGTWRGRARRALDRREPSSVARRRARTAPRAPCGGGGHARRARRGACAIAGCMAGAERLQIVRIVLDVRRSGERGTATRRGQRRHLLTRIDERRAPREIRASRHGRAALTSSCPVKVGALACNDRAVHRSMRCVSVARPGRERVRRASSCWSWPEELLEHAPARSHPRSARSARCHAASAPARRAHRGAQSGHVGLVTAIPPRSGRSVR